MHKRRHNAAKMINSALYGHFSFWIYSLRTILMAIFVLLMAYMLVRSTQNSVAINRYRVYLGETLFSYVNVGFNLIMTSVAFMVMMSELPKRVSYQNYTAFRMSRKKWLMSLIAFCLVIVAVFFLIMLMASALFSLSFVTAGSGWSDLERLAENKNYIHEIQYAPEYVRGMSPFLACSLASVILYLFWVTLALLLLLFSLCGMPNFGVVFCVSLLLMNITILFESLPGIKLPSHFATLNSIASQVYEHKLQFAVKVICGYFILDALLIVLMDARVKNMEFRYIRKE